MKKPRPDILRTYISIPGLLLWLALSMGARAQQQPTLPVLNQNFPDPTVIRVGEKYYAYATNSSVGGRLLHIQVAVSEDLQHWERAGDALPAPPAWAEKDFWAPHVLFDPLLQQYVLFYSAESRDTTTGKCLGVAFADRPEGPFIDKGSPLLCGKDFEDIDPFAFIDPETGKKLLYWGSGFQPIRVQEMSDDWKSFRPGSRPQALVYPGREGTYDRLIEGSWVSVHRGKYYLFYSGDNCCGPEAHYAVMVARADHATGPFVTMGKATGTNNSVVLQQNTRWLAPGHNSVFQDGSGNSYMAYHAISRGADQQHGRVFCIRPLHFEKGWPVVQQPDTIAHHQVVWKDTLPINNDPVHPAIKGGKGRYGSQYGRMIIRHNGQWLSAYTVSRNPGYKADPKGGYTIEIATSNDSGAHWTPIAQVGEAGRDVDNAALIELPDHSLLLGCRSVRWQESYRLPVYRSTDGGQNWEKISTIDTNEGAPGSLGHPDKGIYEPHFLLLNDGRLAVMYANEKHVVEKPSYSQIISEKISADGGRSWGPEIRATYVPGQPAARPGMPVWTQLKNGAYLLTYEVCGPQACNIYYKVSNDGIHWPVGIGHPIAHQTGAPYVLTLEDGTLLLTSNRGNISISEDNGESWYLSSRPWNPLKSYAEDWTQTIWSALYQTAPGKIGIISSVQREGGGHAVLLRLGTIKEEE